MSVIASIASILVALTLFSLSARIPIAEGVEYINEEVKGTSGYWERRRVHYNTEWRGGAHQGSRKGRGARKHWRDGKIYIGHWGRKEYTRTLVIGRDGVDSSTRWRGTMQYITVAGIGYTLNTRGGVQYVTEIGRGYTLILGEGVQYVSGVRMGCIRTLRDILYF